ncbi:MAG: DUF2251 domain-containing protein [Patescibacteria group bacterium]
MENNIFTSKLNNDKTLGGVFEFEDGTGYFYLYDLNNEESKKVINSIFISKDENDFTNKEIEIKWSSDQENVALFVGDVLWAIFNVKEGKTYHKNDINKGLVNFSSLGFIDN